MLGIAKSPPVFERLGEVTVPSGVYLQVDVMVGSLIVNPVVTASVAVYDNCNAPDADLIFCIL